MWIPEDVQGRSLVPLLRGERPDGWRRGMYYHYYEYPGPHLVRPHYGVRTEGHKLIRYYTIDEWELFDLETDPWELHSVYDAPAFREVREELVGQLRRLRRELGDGTGAFLPG